MRAWVADATLLAVGALDIAAAVLAERSPYFHGGAPVTILGASARALTAVAVASRLGRAAMPMPWGSFRGAIVLSLLSLWAPRPVWLYTAAHPAFDPFAPMVANLLQVIPVSLAVVLFMQSALRSSQPLPPSRRSRYLHGPLPRITALVLLAGYPMQVPWVWDPTRRTLLLVLGALWQAILGACALAGSAALLRRLRAPGDAIARASARYALWGIGLAVSAYLAVRVASGDLGDWARSLPTDLGRPYGPFSFFAVRRSAADSAGSIGFSFALLAFALTMQRAATRRSRLRA